MKEIWQCIDWKGSIKNNRLKIYPTINELKSHFENIYTTEDKLETTKINQLTSDIYIPVLDDLIDNREVQDALKDCKKGDMTLLYQS